MTGPPSRAFWIVGLLLAIPTGATGQISGRDVADGGPVDPLSLPRPSLRALRITEPIRMDGRLDESAWSQAEATDDRWIQIGPDPGFPGTERTVVRVLYDEEALYVGADLYDPEPEALIVPGLEQDFDTGSSDIFGIALDTYWDRSNGFLFAVNPAGALFDAQAANDQRDINRSWEGIVEVETSVQADRWVVEMRIPFSTLRYAPATGEQTWGLNFSRRIRRRNEDTFWSPLERQHRVYKFSLAGTLTGLEGLEGGRSLWVKPYALGESRDGSALADEGLAGDVGMDVKWGLTPRLTLDLTANTDFSQVEVDQEQVNLDRFSLFFPEKRDFFLENEGTFAFQDVQIRNYRTGSSSQSFRLFNSRGIGLGPGRRPVPILGGARLTGRVGGLELGLLEMQTRDVTLGGETPLDVPSENFAVARLKVPVGGAGSVGGMFLNRQTTGGGGDRWNRSWGADANLAFFNNLVASAYWAQSLENDPGSQPQASDGTDRGAGMLQLAWRNAFWDISALAKHVGNAFNPGVGFVDRTGVDRLYGTVGIHPRVRFLPFVLELNPYLDVDVYTDPDGFMETRAVSPGLVASLADGGQAELAVKDRFERVSDPLTIAGVSVPLGEYRFRELTLGYTVPASHALSGKLNFTRGGFFDGERTSLGLQLLLRPNMHWQISAGAQRNDLELAGTAFTADLYSARVRYAHDTRTFASAFVQYNEAADELVTNARFNLIHAPLSDIFVVFTERRLLADAPGGPAKGVLERGITLKATRLLAF